MKARATTSPTTGTIVLLTRLARAVYLRSSVDLVGMNLKNMVVLAYLRDHPSASQQAMTEHLSMDSNTGVLVLNDLEDLEYVERRRDPTDRRRHIVDITDTGLEALEQAEVAQGSIEDEILGGLSASERATFRRLLVKALEDHLPVGGCRPAPVSRSTRAADPLREAGGAGSRSPATRSASAGTTP